MRPPSRRAGRTARGLRRLLAGACLAMALCGCQGGSTGPASPRPDAWDAKAARAVAGFDPDAMALSLEDGAVVTLRGIALPAATGARAKALEVLRVAVSDGVTVSSPGALEHWVLVHPCFDSHACGTDTDQPPSRHVFELRELLVATGSARVVATDIMASSEACRLHWCAAVAAVEGWSVDDGPRLPVPSAEARLPDREAGYPTDGSCLHGDILSVLSELVNRDRVPAEVALRRDILAGLAQHLSLTAATLCSQLPPEPWSDGE